MCYVTSSSWPLPSIILTMGHKIGPPGGLMLKILTMGHKIGPPGGHMFRRGPSCLKPQGLEPIYLACRKCLCVVGAGGRVLLCAHKLYYRRDQLDCPPPNGLNHYNYLSLNKNSAHSTGERFRATMALLFVKSPSQLSWSCQDGQLTQGKLRQGITLCTRFC